MDDSLEKFVLEGMYGGYLDAEGGLGSLNLDADREFKFLFGTSETAFFALSLAIASSFDMTEDLLITDLADDIPELADELRIFSFDESRCRSFVEFPAELADLCESNDLSFLLLEDEDATLDLLSLSRR